MTNSRIWLASLLFGLMSITPVQAGDFDWLQGLSLEARADDAGVRTRLAARFRIGDARVKAVIGDVGGHANAYMVLRLAEMSRLPVDTVIDRYKANQGRGWGVLAKSLGIKPGSREFKALKRGHDLPGGRNHAGRGKSDMQHKGQGKGNKNKDK